MPRAKVYYKGSEKDEEVKVGNCGFSPERITETPGLARRKEERLWLFHTGLRGSGAKQTTCVSADGPLGRHALIHKA